MISRREWGARAPKTAPTKLGTYRGLAIHYEGPHMGTFEHGGCASKVRGIQDFHMNVQQWNDIAYNYIVCPHGYTFEGRGAGIRSAANGTNDANDHYEAACYLGGISDPLTQGAANQFSILYSARGGALLPHSAFISTACPGDELRAWIKGSHSVVVPEIPPTITLTNTFEGENVKLERRVVDVPRLDENGNGYIDVDVPFDHLVSFVPVGPSPDRDGGYENPNWPDFSLKVNNTEGRPRFSIESDVPHGHVSFIVWVIA